LHSSVHKSNDAFGESSFLFATSKRDDRRSAIHALLEKPHFSPAVSPPPCQVRWCVFAFRVMFRRAQTRAALRIAPPKRRWYKDRAAIQATKNVQAIAGYRGTHAREQHMLAKSTGSRRASLF